MKFLLRRPVLWGAIVGTDAIFVIDHGQSWLLAWLFKSPAPTLEITLSHFPRLGFFGAALGAVTFCAIAAAQNGDCLKSRRICLLGGGLIFLISLGEIAYAVWSLSNLAAGRTVSVGLPIAIDLHWQVSWILMSLIFNTELQWAVLLLLIGLWPSRSKTSIG